MGGGTVRWIAPAMDQDYLCAVKIDPKPDIVAGPEERSKRRKLRELLKFEGKMHWEGNLDDLRLRAPMKTSA